jgi:hypothetical protein
LKFWKESVLNVIENTGHEFLPLLFLRKDNQREGLNFNELTTLYQNSKKMPTLKQND